MDTPLADQSQFSPGQEVTGTNWGSDRKEGRWLVRAQEADGVDRSRWHSCMCGVSLALPSALYIHYQVITLLSSLLGWKIWSPENFNWLVLNHPERRKLDSKPSIYGPKAVIFPLCHVATRRQYQKQRTNHSSIISLYFCVQVDIKTCNSIFH